MAALKRQYQIFVAEMVKHGDQVQAYHAAYPKASSKTARVESYRILQIPTIGAAIKEESEKIKTTAQQQAIAELKDEIKASVLTRQQKQEILCKIATGDIEIPVKKPVWDSQQKKFIFLDTIEIPDAGARIRAIEIDNKMTGDYAAEKRKLDLGDTPLVVKEIHVIPNEVNYKSLPDDILLAMMKAGGIEHE